MSSYDGSFNTCAYSGKHLILELWGVEAAQLQNAGEIDRVLCLSATDAGATVLGSNMHHFGGDYGVTGVVMLSESHMSIHTWPELGYAAIDIFMCGSCDPRTSLERIKEYFKPSEVQQQLLFRGLR